MTLSCDQPAPGALASSTTMHAVYQPQHDSALLIDALRASRSAPGARAADLCTGSGVVALETARLGAASVLAIDSCTNAVASAALRCQGSPVTVVHGELGELAEHGTFDLVTCNPPYVPTPVEADRIVECAGPRHAWDAGPDGRSVLDPLCASAAGFLNPGGTLLIVQSEFADATASVAALRRGRLKAAVVQRRSIPFGPVMTARAEWLEQIGLLEPGRRSEELVVIRADRPAAPSTSASASDERR
ncbi:methyltransferase [Gordonia insulae]|uniref:Release factor glutamine methyltransferase n=1 Tax=Gordonia insulae TaxID=2420509 RepID=A0A3G8JRR3_9ACTN|nr:methyltransferase [Gordonia insulae]AZG47586.1 Release factor glutamine methyltransferase [Gordonia insulae]